MRIRPSRPLVTGAVAGLALLSIGVAVPMAQAAQSPSAAAVVVPAAPAEEELHANADSSITISWPASPGATSYRIYRGTAAGGEGTTPVATTSALSYVDAGLSPTPTYFYQITAVNSAGESARTDEDASKTPPPLSTGGTTAGVASGSSLVFYAKDARLAGFDWFQTLTGWFPQVLGSSAASSPGGRVVDMAYSDAGTMSFNNVVVPTAGLYTVDFRYAFQSGLFPGVNNRQMGLSVNGTVITTTQSFPITGSFETYADSALQVHLNAGVNSVTQFAVSDHGLSRVDELIVTPATASVPSGPTHLSATAANAGATLTWTASTSGAPTSYRIYRGTKSDGEAVTPVGTVTGATTTFTDTGLSNNKAYFYFVAAVNATGGSPNSNEVTVTPTAASGGGGGGGGTSPNLALGKPTTASSQENAGTAAANATDGSATTRWSSAFSDPQWIQVDLGATHTVSSVVVQWETAYATAYQIQVSADAATWTTVYSTTTGTGGTQTIPVTGSGRFVRVLGTARATQYGYSIWELQVLGS
jgi:F5/8 type C domain/Fibronectin type III domain